MKPNSPVERLYNGILKENPTLVLILGMCPTLAVTTSAINGFGMGMTTTAVLMFSNLLISMLRNFIPDRVRIPAYIVVIASLVTIVQFVLEAYVPSLNKALGVYIPLIVVNCIILGRAESYASKNGPVSSFFDGLGMGLGFTLALTILGAFRELLGSGCMFGVTILPEEVYTPATIFILAPGAFLVLACLVAVRNKLNNRKPVEERKDMPIGCGDCSKCGNMSCASRSFFDMSVDNQKSDTAAPTEQAKELTAEEKIEAAVKRAEDAAARAEAAAAKAEAAAGKLAGPEKKTGVKAAEKPAAKAAGKQAAKTETKPAAKEADKAEAKAADKAEAKPAAKEADKAESKTAVKAEGKAEDKKETATEDKSEKTIDK